MTAFEYGGSDVEIREEGGVTLLRIDGEDRRVRFLDNGRPYTRDYLNVMAKDVADYARRFVDFHAKQNAYWLELAQHSSSGENS